MQKTKRSFTPLAVALLLLWAVPARAAIIHFVDFIPDGSRSQFNSFELIPNDGQYYTGGAGPYTEDGITVLQVNGNPPNNIWISFFTPDGTKGWYPSGGDYGYTSITRAGGADFFDVGFFFGTGWGGPGTVSWELWNNGTLAQSGTLAGQSNNPPGYLGFGGGGFDEIRMTAYIVPGSNAFAVDAIELRNGVPDPGSSLLLLGMSLAALGAWRKRVG